jgi:hypothetical protein
MSPDCRGFEHARPPREVPLSLRLRLLFGSIVAQMGWVFAGFGSIFVWVFVGSTDLTEAIDFRGPLVLETGTIASSEETGFSVNDTPVYAYHYHFVEGGDTYEGVSYGFHGAGSPGDEAVIEHPANRPERSRIQGLRTSPFDTWVLFVLIFPAVGLAMTLHGIRRGVRAAGLLAHGRPAYAVFKAKKTTSMRINKRPVYRLEFVFEDERGREREVTADALDTALLEDEEREPALYDPDDRDSALLLDGVSGRPAVGDDGAVTSTSGPPDRVFVILPGIVVAANVIAALLAG